MRIAAVTTIKDECDIIELFIRINARFIDHFYIVDTGSIDPSLTILLQLIQEGYPITLMKYDSVEFQHPLIMMQVLRTVPEIPTFDWIALLDADEFILDAEEQLLEYLRAVPDHACAAFKWETFIPLGIDFHQQESPLFSYVRQRAIEPQQFCKIMVRGATAPQITIANGNHLAADAQMQVIPQVLLPIGLGHVPVRSPEQILAKSLIGSHKQSIKTNRGPGENNHWDQMTAYIRRHQYQISHERMRTIAMYYATEICDDKPIELLERGIGRNDDFIHFPELAAINLTQRFDDFMTKLCGIIAAQQQVQKC
jgi:hypothetical protein